MNKLKILMVAPTPYFSDRGCHVRIYEEARALKARGHDVVIATYHLGRDVGDVPVVRIPRVPWYHKLSAGPSWHKPYLDILLLYKVLHTVKRFQPDIVHAHLHEGMFLAALAKRLLKAPVLFDSQGSLCGEILDHGFIKQDSLLHRFFVRLEAWITRQAGLIVTSSTAYACLINSSFPDVSDRLTPLIDAVDTDVFKPLPRDDNLLHELNVPADKKLLVYLGAMTEYQGIDLLLDALKVLQEERNDWHALLMGYPEDEYVERSRQMGLDKNVTFTGKLDYADAPRYLSLGDIALSPKLSVTEANGKLLNYMACGLPCVVFDSKINRELLGSCGSYVRQPDAVSFALGIKGLLDRPERRQELATRSREFAQKKHSWRSRIKTLENIYAGLSK